MRPLLRSPSGLLFGCGSEESEYYLLVGNHHVRLLFRDFAISSYGSFTVDLCLL